MRVAFPIYTRDHLKDAIPQFFQAISPYRNGKPKTLIGHPKPNQVRELSYFVAKIWHRAPVRVTARQKSVKGDRNHIYGRTYWRHAGVSYAVYSVAWAADWPEQLSEHATKAEALAALAAC